MPADEGPLPGSHRYRGRGLILMKRRNKKSKTFAYSDHHVGGWEASEAIADEIGAVNLRPVDEAKAVLRPEEVDKFYAEEFVEKKAAEQPLLWDATGEAAARESDAAAAELATAAAVADFLIAEQQKVVAGARELYEFTVRVLGGYTRRPPYEKAPYNLRLAAILLGDVAGVAGAAILLGETTTLGILQAVSSGTAAITSGLIAHEVKDSRLSRKRQKPTKELTKDERRFAHLFRGGDSGEGIVKWAVGGGLLIGACIAGSIFALRATTEGSTAGWAFGLLAAAVALASWANVYYFTDEVADLIDARRSDFRRELKRLKKASQDKNIARRARATAEATSIKAESTKRGEAAAKDVEALGKQLLHQNPGVAGHGRGKPQKSPSVSHESEKAPGVSSLPGLEHTVPYEPPPEAAAGTNHDNRSGEVAT